MYEKYVQSRQWTPTVNVEINLWFVGPGRNHHCSILSFISSSCVRPRLNQTNKTGPWHRFFRNRCSCSCICTVLNWTFHFVWFWLQNDEHILHTKEKLNYVIDVSIPTNNVSSFLFLKKSCTTLLIMQEEDRTCAIFVSQTKYTYIYFGSSCSFTRKWFGTTEITRAK
jgi:hypothetical protein